MSDSEIKARLDLFAEGLGAQYFRHYQQEITGSEFIIWLIEACHQALVTPLRPEDV